MAAMKHIVKGTDRYRHYINGEWVNSTVKEWIDVEIRRQAPSSHRFRGEVQTTPTVRWKPLIRPNPDGKECHPSHGRSF